MEDAITGPRAETPSDPADWDPRTLPRGRGAIHRQAIGGGWILTLDNPAARNALSPGMMADLAEHVAALQEAEGRWVLLRGAGDAAFCAGGDLKAVRTHLLSRDAAAGMQARMSGVLDDLAALPMVVLAAVEGSALGGGAEVLTACDVVVAAADARVGFVHAALGVSPGWGGGGRLLRRIGPRRALQVLALAEALPADRAAALGVVDRAVPPGAAVAEARAIADRLSRLPEASVRAAVGLCRSGGDPEVEARAFASLWGGPDHRAALARLRHGRDG